MIPGDRFVPWLGVLPDAWKIRPLKHAVRFNPDVLGEDTDPGRLIRYVDISTVDSQGRIGKPEEMTFFDAPSRARRVVRRGDVIVSTVRTYLTAISRIDADDLTVSTGFAVLRPRAGVDSRFLGYWMRSQYIVDEIVARSTGVSYPAVNPTEIGQLPFPTINADEQRVIADFLDRETALLGKLARHKARLIELALLRQSGLIRSAVTAGLRRDAELVRTPIEWLGSVPCHWELKKLGHIAMVIRGASPRPAGSPDFFNGDAVPWITVAEVTKDSSKYLVETATKLTDAGRRQSRWIPSGTIVLTNSGATLGVPKILAISGCINDGSVAFLRLSPRVRPDFLYYYLSSLTENYRERIKQGSGQPNLNTTIVKSTPFPLPPLSEQGEIVTYLDALHATTDDLIRSVDAGLKKVEECRSSLISAAVTGQIDVRTYRTQEAAELCQ